MSPHDNAYKHVFSHPRAVADLLRGFVHEDWVAQLDYTTLEKVSGSYVTDDLRDREDDIIWRIRMARTVGACPPCFRWCSTTACAPGPQSGKWPTSSSRCPPA
jgi:predicted transposase YdaD